MNDFKNLFSAETWYTIVLFGLGILSFFTSEIVTFAMLGFVLISLFNIHNALKGISAKLDNHPKK